MKRILSLLLIFSLFVGCSLPSSYAANQAENCIQNYTSNVNDGEQLISYDAKINQNNYHYNYQIRNGEVDVAITSDGNTDNITINKENNTLVINGIKYELDKVVKIVNSEVTSPLVDTTPQLRMTTASLTSPESLSYNYMGTIEYVVDLAVISGTLIAVSVVAGIICGMLTYNVGAGMKVTAEGIKVSKVSYYISFLAPTAAHFVGDEKICYKIQQFSSTTRALIDPMRGEAYVFKNYVMFFKDKTFSSALSGWELTGYFQ